MITQRDRDLCAGKGPPELVAAYRAAYNCGTMRRRYGLGDWVECLLAAVGITKDLFPGCKCGQRKAWLNRIGGRVSG